MEQQTASAEQPVEAGTATPGTNLISQAQQWLRQGNLNELVGKVPASLKTVGTSFNKLSTTQKIVGGAALALGVGLLARRGAGRKAPQSGDAATTLQELLQFVNDRIAGYEHAVAESKDLELRTYYQRLVSQSQQFAHNLNEHLRRRGSSHETGTTLKGKLYRAWMDTKAAITGSDEKAILGSNVYGEEWAIKAYRDALRDRSLSGPLRQAIQRQYDASQKTYQRLKQLEARQ